MAMDRRSFMGTLGAAVLLRNFPVTLDGGRQLGSIGVQLYTVRREMQRDFEGTLAKVAEIGCQEVEFAGYFGQAPQRVRAVLDESHLVAPSAHISFPTLREGWQGALDDAHIIGHRFLVCASVPADARRRLDDWKRVGDLFNHAGEASQRAGIQFAFHNHDIEFAPLDGKLPYDVLLAASDPTLVQMEMDLYWITKGGQDPLKYFRQYPGRFPMVHVKDVDSTPRRSYAEVGRGIIDFKKIFAQGAVAGIKHYFVEHDEPTGFAFDSIKISLDYLKGLRF